MSINITAKEFQRRMISAANRHHAAMQGMTDNEAASGCGALCHSRYSRSYKFRRIPAVAPQMLRPPNCMA